jgi:hypothetical protein
MCVKQTLTQARQSLSHPLFLIVAGAVLSSYLLPSLTRQWQNHEKELEVRTTLVQEMSETTADFVVAIKQSTFGGFGEEQAGAAQARALNVAWRAFDRRQTVIAAKLRSYFPESGLGDEWKRYAGALVSFLYFLKGENEKFTRIHRENVVKYIGEERTLDSLEHALVQQDRLRGTPRQEEAQEEGYVALEAFIAVEKRWYSTNDALVGQVLATDTAI